jgi:hypothetical protein
MAKEKEKKPVGKPLWEVLAELEKNQCPGGVCHIGGVPIAWWLNND